MESVIPQSGASGGGVTEGIRTSEIGTAAGIIQIERKPYP